MKAWCGWGSLLTCIAIACLSPTSASAKSGYFVEPARKTIEINVKGTNGYRLQAWHGGGRMIDLSARKGASFVSYFVRGRRTPTNAIDADFGDLGRVSMRFHWPSSSPPEHLAPADNCKGRDSIVRTGTFRGHFRFAGELNYTTVDTNHASGKIVKTFKQTCKNEEGKESHTPHLPFQWTLLHAASESGPGLLGFDASRITWRSQRALHVSSFFGASSFESDHRVSIIRSVSASAGVDAFSITTSNGHPQSAIISPPQPFSGTASFQRNADGSTSWTGSLSVSFPGTEQVPLTGPDWKAQLGLQPSGGSSVIVIAGPSKPHR